MLVTFWRVKNHIQVLGLNDVHVYAKNTMILFKSAKFCQPILDTSPWEFLHVYKLPFIPVHAGVTLFLSTNKPSISMSLRPIQSLLPGDTISLQLEIELRDC